jgi:hypothetical protein
MHSHEELSADLVPGDGTLTCKTKLCDDVAEALAVTRVDAGMGIQIDWMGASRRQRLSRGQLLKSVQIGKKVYILYSMLLL